MLASSFPPTRPPQSVAPRVQAREAPNTVWVPEDSLARFLVCIFEVWPARGPGRPPKMLGASPPALLRAFPGPRGQPDLKNAPKQIRPDPLPGTDGLTTESGAHFHTLMTSYGVGGNFLDWVLEGNLAGFLGCVFEVRPAPGARKGFQKCGGFAPRGLIQHFMGCCPLPQNWGAASARSPLPQ